ncbi:MAG: hypothetical protein ACHQAW_04205 [Actinomycetota bacterium]|jgi:hypothetical protein
MGRPYDEVPHDAVVSNLLDLQARLRGDPASMVVPKVGRPTVPNPVAIVQDDVVVIEVPESVDPLEAGTQDAEDRIEALRRRLQFLELEIDAYESAVSDLPATPAEPVGEADVIDLQHAVDRRLTHD